MERSYIGCDGFCDHTQIAKLKSIIPDGSVHHLKVGVQIDGDEWFVADSKTGQFSWPFKPHEVFGLDFKVLNFAVISGCKPRGQLAGKLNSIVSIVGGNCDGFDLEMTHPCAEQLKLFHSFVATRRFRLVVRLTWLNFEMCNYNPDELVEWAKQYEEYATDFLLDLSGDSVEYKNTYDVLLALQKNMPTIGLGILLRGIGDQDWIHLERFAKRFPRLNIDGGSSCCTVNGELDIDRARKFLLRALFLF